VELAASVDAVVAGDDQFSISRVRIDAQVKITLNLPFTVLPILTLLNKKTRARLHPGPRFFLIMFRL
jgi:hypothetical protein